MKLTEDMLRLAKDAFDDACNRRGLEAAMAVLREHTSASGEAEALRSQLAAEVTEREHAERAFRQKSAELAAVRSKLAARPEPVVVDEALAVAFLEAWRALDGWSIGDILAALRAVLGERVSVAGQQLQVEHAEMRKRWLSASEDNDKLRADLQATSELREQYEALRAGVQGVYNWLEQCGDRSTSSKLRALLKPATPEPRLSAADCLAAKARIDATIGPQDEPRAPWVTATAASTEGLADVVRLQTVDAIATPEPRADNATVTPGHQYAWREDVEKLEKQLGEALAFVETHRRERDQARNELHELRHKLRRLGRG